MSIPSGALKGGSAKSSVSKLGNLLRLTELGTEEQIVGNCKACRYNYSPVPIARRWILTKSQFLPLNPGLPNVFNCNFSFFKGLRFRRLARVSVT